jgi:uncharacterized protein (TIGR02452 family)
VAELVVLPCLDDPERASACRRKLQLPRGVAANLGFSAVVAAQKGSYRTSRDQGVEIASWVDAAKAARLSIPPDAALPPAARRTHETRVLVANETTLVAARRLTEAGARPLALNFANGIAPGGGFLLGALAQEEVLCRSSVLHATLEGDAMYEAHKRRGDDESSDWAILSPDVPFFRADGGEPLDAPWRLSVVTCAAPIASRVGQPRSGDLLKRRIERVLSIADAYGYETLVLGAWGCGAFGNDPLRTARDFKDALAGRFEGAFQDVVFAIADWSPERRFLGPFRDAFASPAPRRCE